LDALDVAEVRSDARAHMGVFREEFQDLDAGVVDVVISATGDQVGVDSFRHESIRSVIKRAFQWRPAPTFATGTFTTGTPSFSLLILSRFSDYHALERTDARQGSLRPRSPVRIDVETNFNANLNANVDVEVRYRIGSNPTPYALGPQSQR
jgi:hypothetical protein